MSATLSAIFILCIW